MHIRVFMQKDDKCIMESDNKLKMLKIYLNEKMRTYSVISQKWKANKV